MEGYTTERGKGKRARPSNLPPAGGEEGDGEEEPPKKRPRRRKEPNPKVKRTAAATPQGSEEFPEAVMGKEQQQMVIFRHYFRAALDQVAVSAHDAADHYGSAECGGLAELVSEVAEV